MQLEYKADIQRRKKEITKQAWKKCKTKNISLYILFIHYVVYINVYKNVKLKNVGSIYDFLVIRLISILKTRMTVYHNLKQTQLEYQFPKTLS